MKQQTMKQQTLHIDPEFKAQIPPLTEDERRQLEETFWQTVKSCPRFLSGMTPLWTGTTGMRFCKATRRFPITSAACIWKRGKMFSPGSARTSSADGI